MKVRITNNKSPVKFGLGVEIYEFSCVAKACNYCPFRFKCFTERDTFDVTTDEMDDLSLRFVAGGELLDLIHAKRTNLEYYQSLFYKITREREAWGFIPLLHSVSGTWSQIK